MMKKLMTLLVAVMMVFTMASKVDAATNDGTITLDNAVVGEKYKIYKVFDLTYSESGGTLKASYYYTKTGDTDALYTALTGTDSPFKLTATATANKYSVTLKDETTTGAAIATFFKANVSNLTEVTGKATAGLDTNGVATATTVKWENLDYGYYYVSTSLGSLVALDSTTKAATIKEKNTVPTLKKEVKEQTEADTAYAKAVDAGVNETVTYRVTVNTGENANSTATGIDKNFVIEDVYPSNGLLHSDGVGLTITDADDNTWVKGTDYTVMNNGTDHKFTVTLLATGKLGTLGQNKDIYIVYDVVVGTDIPVDTKNQNTATLTYGTLDNKVRATDTASVYSWSFNVLKYAEENDTEGYQSADTLLAGATFKLCTDTAGQNEIAFVKTETANVYKVKSTSGPTVPTAALTTTDAGVLTLQGLDSGTYYLFEVEAPEGYNPMDGYQTITITSAADSTDKEKLTKTVTEATTTYNNDKYVAIENKTGAVLPSTGGIGTTIFHVAGALLVLGAGIVLISKKRANNN